MKPNKGLLWRTTRGKLCSSICSSRSHSWCSFVCGSSGTWRTWSKEEKRPITSFSNSKLDKREFITRTFFFSRRIYMTYNETIIKEELCPRQLSCLASSPSRSSFGCSPSCLSTRRSSRWSPWRALVLHVQPSRQQPPSSYKRRVLTRILFFSTRRIYMIYNRYYGDEVRYHQLLEWLMYCRSIAAKYHSIFFLNRRKNIFYNRRDEVTSQSWTISSFFLFFLTV